MKKPSKPALIVAAIVMPVTVMRIMLTHANGNGAEEGAVASPAVRLVE